MLLRLVPLFGLALLLAPLGGAPARAAPDQARQTPVVRAVQQVAPAVVSITTERVVDDPFAWHGPRVASGEGSGVVIDPDGIVLTNAHVVAGAQRIVASFADDTRAEATVLGLDADLDLAVLRVDADGLTAVPIGTSSDLMLGEPVIAIGNPLGLGHTVTTGVISAVSRPVPTDRRVYQDFIQTDASINPGNSGGPLLNVHGDLIGINTAIRADAQNIGFAIPVDRAVKVARDLVTFGTVQVPWLGVDLTDVRIDRQGTTAPQVERVYPDTSSADAGLRPGDVLVELEGREVKGRADLNAHLAAYEPGEPLRVTYLRGSTRARHAAVLRGGRPSESVVDAILSDRLGVALAERGGVLVAQVQPGGAFERSGIRAGDRIVAVNGEAVASIEELRRALGQAKSGHRTSALLTIQRGRTYGRLTFSI